jgi:hypothetical protein
MTKNILLALGLLCTSATLLPVGEQERDVLYAMHAMGKDFSGVVFLHNAQNLAMFISLFKINSDVLEAKLKIVSQKVRKEFISQLGVTGMVFSIQFILIILAERNIRLISRECFWLSFLTANAVALLGNIWSIVNFYDVFKEKNRLEETLALDKEILEKLEKLRNTLPVNFEDSEVDLINSQQTENPALESTISS